MLDSRVPPTAGGYAEEEQRRVSELEKRVEELMVESRWWRVANSAQWVAWGIVQANIPELEALDEEDRTPCAKVPMGVVEGMEELDLDGSAGGGGEEGDGVGGEKEAAVEEDGKEDDDEFDYVAYAHDRAMFFWGDCVALGLVKLEDLPRKVQEAVKIVDH